MHYYQLQYIDPVIIEDFLEIQGSNYFIVTIPDTNWMMRLVTMLLI